MDYCIYKIKLKALFLCLAQSTESLTIATVHKFFKCLYVYYCCHKRIHILFVIVDCKMMLVCLIIYYCGQALSLLGQCAYTFINI